MQKEDTQQGELFDPKNFHQNGDRLQDWRLQQLEASQGKIMSILDNLVNKMDEVVRRIKDDKLPLEQRLTKLEQRQAILWGALGVSGAGHIATLVDMFT